MTELTHWREQIRTAVAGGDVPVIDSPSVATPATGGTIVIPLDQNAPDAARVMRDTLNPRAIVLGARDDDQDSFDVHLIGTTWVQLLFVTLEALESSERADETEPPPLTGADHSALAQAVKHLSETTPLSGHGGPHEAFDLLMAHLHDQHPDLASRVAGQWLTARTAASQLANDLRDQHRHLLRANAPQLALQVIADEGLAATMPRAMVKDRVYANLKRIDPTCVTRSSIESVMYEVHVALARGGTADRPAGSR